jgi:hypothetical protein
LLLDPIVDHLPGVENRRLYNKSSRRLEKMNEISALGTIGGYSEVLSLWYLSWANMASAQGGLNF